MNKLFIEVNNQDVKATIYTQRENSWVLLASETFGKKRNWATELAENVKLIDETLMYDYSLLMNFKSNIVNVQKVNTYSETSEKAVLENIMAKKLASKYENFDIIKNDVEVVSYENGKAKLLVKTEMVKKEIIVKTLSSLIQAGFARTKKFVSIIDTFENAVIEKGTAYNLHIDAQSSFVNKFEEGKLVKLSKREFGIDEIYKTLSKNMMVTKEKAISLFKHYGSIPPKMVKDNRVIHSHIDFDGNHISIDKREMSEMITEKIDKFIAGTEQEINQLEDINAKVIYSGDITILRGAEGYISSRLKFNISKTHESDIFGFDSVNHIIADGAIKSTKFEEVKTTKTKNTFLQGIKQLFVK